MPTKEQLLAQTIEHVDITRYNVVDLVDAMRHMAYSARDLSRAADIYDRMLRDKECGIILCLAGSLVSAGLKGVFVEMIRSRMIDCIVSTGANIVDQDFFEALGYRHYIADERLKAGVDDAMLRDAHIDRIYDTLIDEDELRICDDTTRIIADELPPRPYSSREFIKRWAPISSSKARGKARSSAPPTNTICRFSARRFPIAPPVSASWPISMPAAISRKSPSTASKILRADAAQNQKSDDGHLHARRRRAEKLHARHRRRRRHPGEEPPMHKYAVQITVADVRDGALSSSTLKEASSWGKVDTVYEQMVFSEATLALPLIAGYAWHKSAWKTREAKRFSRLLEPTGVAAS